MHHDNQLMTSLPGYFTKIPNFINPTANILENLKLGEHIIEFAGINTLLEYYVIKDVNYILSQHIRKICNIDPTYIIYAQITNKGLLGAHIDHGPIVNLNFYLQAAEDITHFYKKNEKVTGYQYTGQKEANIFDYRELEHVGSFVANTNEAYLLNVSEIHSVEKVTDTKRSFISYCWHHNTYEEVLANLC